MEPSQIPCSQIRDALSAHQDGEDADIDDPSVEDHLGTCPACRMHTRRIESLHRQVRVRSAEPVPDLTEGIMARAEAAGRLPRPAPAAPEPSPVGDRGYGRADPAHLCTHWARYALLAVALTQLILAIPALIGGDASGASIHLARELGSWDLAMAVGWLVVAHQPRRAGGLLPFAIALAAAVMITAGVDVAAGREVALSEGHHALDVAGLALVWVLTRATDARPLRHLVSGRTPATS